MILERFWKLRTRHRAWNSVFGNLSEFGSGDPAQGESKEINLCLLAGCRLVDNSDRAGFVFATFVGLHTLAQCERY